MLIWSVLGRRQQVKCLQVGAHDGRTGDHLCELRSAPRWTSYLLEPNPAILPILRLNTLQEAGTKILPFALAPQAGRLDLWTVHTERLPNDLKRRLDFTQISALDRGKVAGELKALIDGAEIPDEWIAATSVDVITWDILFSQHVNGVPDCVLIDAEGQDAGLLLAFPFSKGLPGVLVFEYLWMTAEEVRDVTHRLRVEGYVLVSVGQDTVAIHKTSLEQLYHDHMLHPSSETV